MNSQSHLATAFDRERELDEQRHRAIQQQDDIAHREREREREREQAERHQREPYPSGTPLHSTAGSIPIHQPVASRISGAIHSPGGLLANHGGAASSIPLGAPPGPVANFGGPLHGEPRGALPHPPPASSGDSQQHMFAPLPHSSVAPTGSLGVSSGPPAFGGPLQPEAARGGAQQPILNVSPSRPPTGSRSGDVCLRGGVSRQVDQRYILATVLPLNCRVCC